MKLLVYIPTGFELNQQHLSKIKSVADVEIKVAKSEEEIDMLIQDADILLCSNHTFSPNWLKNASKLKWINSIAAGVERILPAIENSDVILTNSRGVHSIPITEQVLGYMIMHERKLDFALKAQLKKEWTLHEFRHSTPGELYGKTALIVGLGKIGKRMAEIFKCMGMNVLAVKKDVSSSAENVDKIYRSSELKSALPNADYIIVALPHTTATHHLFGANEFASMKKTAFFINIGRGSIVDEPALEAALSKKVIAGAALDVFETEPLPNSSQLWSMNNVILTPHYAGLTPRYMDRAVDIFCKNFQAFLDKKPLPNLVDKQKQY